MASLIAAPLRRAQYRVLFDLDAAELINRFLFQVKKITFDFAEAANPYFLRSHYDNKRRERA
jgi:hypothetical protein